MNKIKYIAALVIGIAALGLQQAKADSIGFDLGTGNSGISGFPGPYVHVVVNRTDATHATISFTGLINSGNIYLMGGAQAVDFNVNATSWTVGLLSSSRFPGFSSQSSDLTIAGANNADGFGSFNQTVDNFDGYTHSWTSLEFSLTNTSGTWASASAVLTPNASGLLAAAHIFVGVGNPPNPNVDALATGFAANGTPSVPDGGATAMLLGAGLSALGMVRRFLKR